MIIYQNGLPEDQQAPGREEPEKTLETYHKPQLFELGDLRTLTLGISPTGFTDSGTGGLWEYVG